MQKVKVRGLVLIPAWIFLLWGSLILLKSFCDLLWGQPESNFYSPKPWDFVSREEWLRYAGLGLCYALSCLAAGWFLFSYGGLLPHFVERKKKEETLE